MTTTTEKPKAQKHTGQPIDEEVFDFSDIAVNRRFQMDTAMRKGHWRVWMEPARPKKTLPQLGYYYSTIIKYFAMFIRSHDPAITIKQASDDAHNRLKELFFSRPIVHPDTGQLIATNVKSVADASKQEMSVYIDNCIDYLGSEWEIPIPPPSHTERFGEPVEESHE